MSTGDSTARTWVDVDLDRIASNLDTLRAALPRPADVLMPVKANAYGHGLVPVSRAALKAGAWGLGIAALDEAETLRAAAIDAPIVCLMPILPEEAERAVDLDVTPAIMHLDQARALSTAATKRGTTCPVHIDVDTGMGRSGVWDHDVLSLVEAVARLPGIRTDGIFTHFSSADEARREATQEQLDRFDRILSELEKAHLRPSRVHAANSAAALRFGSATRAIVRPGIVIYGSSEEIAPDADFGTGEATRFDPALSWRARVVAIKELRAGDSVSYHRTYVAERDERIALLGVGYGDGWSFSLSNRGHVLLRGTRVPIRGSVCMDLTMVDASAFGDLEVGEVATLIGEDGAVRQSVADVGRSAGLMSYAVLTAISNRVRRRYTGGGAG